ncbi:MAG: hypothetical protein ACLR3C_16045, partial [Eggerthella lenta]
AGDSPAMALIHHDSGRGPYGLPTVPMMAKKHRIRKSRTGFRGRRSASFCETPGRAVAFPAYIVPSVSERTRRFPNSTSFRHFQPDALQRRAFARSSRIASYSQIRYI